MNRTVPATVEAAMAMTQNQWNACWKLTDLTEREKHVLQVAQLRLATTGLGPRREQHGDPRPWWAGGI